MTDVDEPQKICLEFAEFPGAEMPWLIEKAKVIEEAMSLRLDGMFVWHSVVAHPEIAGFRVFFQVDPDSGGFDRSATTTLVEIVREATGDDLSGSAGLAA